MPVRSSTFLTWLRGAAEALLFLACVGVFMWLGRHSGAQSIFSSITPFPETPTPTATPEPTPGCGLAWRGVASPNTNWRSRSNLKGISALSPDDIWAVGSDNATSTITLHWDVAKWYPVPSPNPNPGGFNDLTDVVALSPNNVWAVGWYGQPGGGNDMTLVLHWDGVSWSIVPSPNPGIRFSVLNAITAISAQDIWDVGYYSTQVDRVEPLIMHWDGSQWQAVPGPALASAYNYLNDIAGASSTDVWTVGFSTDASAPLIMHWNGVQWLSVPNPPGVEQGSGLSSLAVVSSNDVWAVGEEHYNQRPLICHWDGTAWSVFAALSSAHALTGVAAISPSDIWAVGLDGSRRSPVIHWNGSSWSEVSGPGEGDQSGLLAVAAIAHEVWAVGYAVYPYGWGTWSARYSEPCVPALYSSR